ncbi:prepilin-type N-terminal cleavage/methylation domain-containing protein [Caminicella sporogenes DSM 14501]|uniref:Prepilin-type N-terminal cleavage/methylation domain-containing protein n=1 Tax=Caminicella sporogenes DSM 14501 TaxID=1121266 RepID=A0A1M6LN62_9FIRM|nr:type II secretion system protein [Caminicella sporogenes]RKD27890.1 hypothetical protein BET04_02180 [Caminicella sporogenes]SHJ72627.1 prepilin-type N-terminal cleavage/methylation domain-containing protein [Caminicella sporogenes DSM 14501]
MNNKHGFTLVEVLISIAIMGIILSAVFSFFLSNYKTFIKSDNQIEAQYQAQIAMNELVENIMEAEALVVADLGNRIGNKYPVKTLVFKIYDEERDVYIKYEYKEDKLYRTSKLEIPLGFDIKDYYKKDKFNTNQYAVGIKDFKIELIGGDKTELEKVRGIKIFITSSVGSEEITLTNQVYFRNWKKEN